MYHVHPHIMVACLALRFPKCLSLWYRRRGRAWSAMACQLKVLPRRVWDSNSTLWFLVIQSTFLQQSCSGANKKAIYTQSTYCASNNSCFISEIGWDLASSYLTLLSNIYSDFETGLLSKHNNGLEKQYENIAVCICGHIHSYYISCVFWWWGLRGHPSHLISCLAHIVFAPVSSRGF